jgi:4-diphosphocytidyl-2-C-methyl-D-erythritol kinase
MMVLNRLDGAPLPDVRLLQLAQELGSDVPFFLQPQPQWAEGRGERLRPIVGFPALPVLLVKPPFSIATAQAYREVRPRPDPLPNAPAHPALDSLEAVVAALVNDFEPALFPARPVLATIKERLLAAGARGALLSGSGSAVFGLFADTPTRDRAASTLAQEEPAWTVLPCDTLERHRYSLTELEAQT